MIQLLGQMLVPVTRWAEHSQREACRNAMVASTDLAQRRQERVEVADYLDQALGAVPSQAHRAGSAPPSLPAARLG